MPQVPQQTSQSQLDFLLLDGSASMRPKWWDCLSAIDTYVHGLKAGNVNSRVVLSVFDSNAIFDTARDQFVDDWKALSEEPIGAYWGTTPLYDAIEQMGLFMKNANPPRAAITIYTDGDENASLVCSRERAKGILDWCRAKGWQVTFVGCDFDNSKLAGLLGGDQKTALGASLKHLSDATSALAKKRTAYGLYGTPMHWSDDEQQRFGGFLPPPSDGAA